MPEGGFELTFELEVARPRDDVFALLIDPDHFRLVDPALVDQGPPGSLTPGSCGATCATER